MRHVLSISILASLLVLPACGDGDGDSDSVDSGSGVDAGSQSAEDSGPPDAGAEDEPDAYVATDAGPEADVEWVVEPEPLTIDTDIGIRLGYEYRLAIAGDPFVYSVELHRCMNIATREPNCWMETPSNVPGSYFVGWGIDPTGYGIGENSYSFRIVVKRGETIVDEDTVQLDVTVTACQTCIGSGNEPTE